MATTPRRPSTPYRSTSTPGPPQVTALQRRPLTPDASSGLHPPLGPFFDLLPFELRRMILEEAFGNRLVRVYHTLELQVEAETPVTKRRWRHSMASRKEIIGVHGALGSSSPQPLGAMGWILACRQAYAEGIDVLYSTSKFSFDAEPRRGPADPRNYTLIHAFCTDMPLQRLASITSLYFSCRVSRGPDSEFPLPFELLSSTFPGLRQLHVFLMGPLEEIIPGAVDDFVRSRACRKLEVLYVSVVPWAIGRLRKQCMKDEDPLAWIIGLAGFAGQGFWRSVAADETSRSSFRGYWIFVPDPGTSFEL